MRKKNWGNLAQRIMIFACMWALLMGTCFTEGKFSKARGQSGKVETCSLQSVTLAMSDDENAPTIVCTGGLNPIAVNAEVSWQNYFSAWDMKEASFVADNDCTAKGENGEHYVAAYLFMPEGAEYYYYEYAAYSQATDDGEWVEWCNITPYGGGDNYVYRQDFEMGDRNDEDVLVYDVGYIDAKFEPGYGMVSGTSPTGIYVRFSKEYPLTLDLAGGELTEKMDTYLAGGKQTLPTPKKEGYIFDGWTRTTATGTVKETEIPTDCMGALTYTATWKERVTPTLHILPTASAIDNGQALKESALTSGQAVVDGTDTVIEGTFAWKDATLIPTLEDSEKTEYIVTFTPKDISNYKEIECKVKVKVNAVVGDAMKSQDGEASYEIIVKDGNNIAVSYEASVNKTKTVTIPATVTLADGTVAKVTSIAEKAFKGNSKVQVVTIGKNVKTINKEAFSGCKNLKKVKSAKNVTSIGKNAFANCSKLKSVAMSTKITSLGEKAFYNCKSLKKITIPKNVKSIGKSTFQNCKNLKTIKINTTKLTKKNVKKSAFKGIHSKVKIDVPNSKVKAYKSTLQARGVSKNATIK